MIWMQGIRAIACAGLALAAGGGACAQDGKQLDPPAAGEVADRAGLTSPLPAVPRGLSIHAGTEIPVMVSQPLDSGTRRNGDSVSGRLAAPVRTTTGQLLPRGTKVEATVVSAAKAGTIASGGVLSLQLTRVGTVAVVTDVLDFNGREGTKDVADSAPGKGTEAVVRAGTTLHFKVMEVGKVPGIVAGVAPAKGAGGDGATPLAGPPSGTAPGMGAAAGAGGITGVTPAGTSPPR